MSALLSLVPLVAVRAQRATQVVRYSITGVSQGKISNSTGAGGTAGKTGSGLTTGGFGSASASTSSSSRALAGTMQKPAIPASRRAATVPVTTTPVWEATYQVSNNEANKKLAISIDSPMPDGMELTADIGAPQGADASGPVDLETGAKDVVTAIGTGESAALPIQFSLTANQGSTEDAGTRTVTFTFISGS